MITSDIKKYEYENGEIQLVQKVGLENWQDLAFVFPAYQPEAFEHFCHIYEKYLVAAFPLAFGQMVLFHDEQLPETTRLFMEGISLKGKKLSFKTPQVKEKYEELLNKGQLKVISGKAPYVKIIPVNSNCGFISKCPGRLKVNSSFFIMDNFDCATVYDSVPTPLGLMVKEGKIINPPLYDRETLLVSKTGKVEIRKVYLHDLMICINEHVYKHGDNATIYCRPDHGKTPKNSGSELVIVGRIVVDITTGGKTPVPASGFVLSSDDIKNIKINDEVSYKGMEDVAFGIQVGNSVIVDGVPTREFITPFHDFKKLNSTVYPPSMYPLNFKKDRAARMVLGCDENNKPLLVWFEGKGKLTYQKGIDSCGASLQEVADICQDLGMYNGINLDGGGSAQILLNDKRELMISDRDSDNQSMERPLPVGLIIR